MKEIIYIIIGLIFLYSIFQQIEETTDPPKNLTYQDCIVSIGGDSVQVNPNCMQEVNRKLYGAGY